jgi:hypothetical protein
MSEDIDRESPAYEEAFDLIQGAIAGLDRPLTHEVVVAFLETIADYVVPPGDFNAARQFIEVASAAATSAVTGTVS